MKNQLKRLSTAAHLKTVYEFVEKFVEQNIEAEAGFQMLIMYIEELLDLTKGWWRFMWDHQAWRLHRDLDRIWSRLRIIHGTNSEKRAFQQAEYVLYGACVAYGFTELKRPHDIEHRLQILTKNVFDRSQMDEYEQKIAREMFATMNPTKPLVEATATEMDLKEINKGELK